MKLETEKQYANQKPAGFDTRTIEQLRADWSAKKVVRRETYYRSNGRSFSGGWTADGSYFDID